MDIGKAFMLILVIALGSILLLGRVVECVCSNVADTVIPGVYRYHERDATDRYWKAPQLAIYWFYVHDHDEYHTVPATDDVTREDFRHLLGDTIRGSDSWTPYVDQILVNNPKFANEPKASFVCSIQNEYRGVLLFRTKMEGIHDGTETTIRLICRWSDAGVSWDIESFQYVDGFDNTFDGFAPNWRDIPDRLLLK